MREEVHMVGVGTFLVYMAVDAMNERRHLEKEFEKACFGDF